MKNKKPENLAKASHGYILPVVVLIIFLALTAIIYKKYSENTRYRVIKVSGVSTVSNLSKLELFDYSSMANDSACYPLAEKGDLLSLDNVLYEVPGSTGDSLNVTTKEDTATYINGRMYTLIINDKIDLVPFLKSLSDKEIKSLSNLQLESAIPEKYLPFLKKIASVNNDLSLYFVEDSASIIMKDYFARANYFNPRVFSGAIDATLYPKIASLTNITTLFISIEDSTIVPLPNLPKLEKCIVIDAAEKGFSTIMENNSNATLVYLDTESFSNEDLRKFKTLPTLAIYSSDSAVLQGLNESIKHTSTLYISFDSNGITSELGRFSNVKWLILEGGFSTETFTKTLTYFQNTQVIEIKNNKTLSGYKNLAELPNLHALIIRDTVIDFNGLLSLKQLKYLSLPDNLYSDSAKLNSLEKALPGCIIAPNAGACLGSAWLLLIPVIFLFKFYIGRKNILLKKLQI